MRYGWISFTSDYGLDDPFVGVCHGVIAGIAPAVRVIDVTHGVPAGNIRHGAHALAQAVAYLPEAIHLAVVDPGVGTARRGVVVVARHGLLVGPDNGLLPLAADVLGGIVAGYELTAAEYQLPPVSATFHGRDVFAPAVAHLALGVNPAEFGPQVQVSSLVRLSSPAPTVRPGALITEVLSVDHFGNVQLAAPGTTLMDAGFGEGARVTVRVSGRESPAVVGRTFFDVEDSELVVLVDSADRVALAINGGSAAVRLGLPSSHLTLECAITGSPSPSAPGALTT